VEDTVDFREPALGPDQQGGRFLLILSEDVELVATEADHRDAVARTGEYVMGLAAEGRLAGGGLLRPAEEARRIRTREGRSRVLDGPFVEAKEVIAGYLVIRADSLDEALAIAGRCPNVDFGSVEVREVVPGG
jgi:hypothetical protein